MSIMKHFIALVLISFIYVSKGVQGRYNGTRAEDLRCEKLHTYYLKYVEMMKAEKPTFYNQMKTSIKVLARVDIENPSDMKGFICKLANAKTLNEVHNLMPFIPKDQFFTMYRFTVRMVSDNGGYTNTRRILESSKEFLDWVKSLNINDPTEIKENTSLEDVENFFKVMQVKYGSRWLSLITIADNQELLIEDPVIFAKTLYECSSQADFQQRTHFPEDFVIEFWRVFTDKMVVSLSSPLVREKYFDLMVEGENLMGELGLYNLEY